MTDHDTTVSGNVGGIARQVRAYVLDLKDGPPAKVALAASRLRVLVSDSSGKVRSPRRAIARCLFLISLTNQRGVALISPDLLDTFRRFSIFFTT